MLGNPLRGSGRALSVLLLLVVAAVAALAAPAAADQGGLLAIQRTRWAYANSANVTYGDTGGLARVGRDPGCCSGAWRSFFEFPLGQLSGARIRAATLETTLVHSWSCVPMPVSLYRSGGIGDGVGDGGRTPWSPVLVEALTDQYGATCGGTAQRMSFPITDKLQQWVDAGLTTVTLGLVTNEVSVQYWKKFSVAQTVLRVDYAPASELAGT